MTLKDMSSVGLSYLVIANVFPIFNLSHHNPSVDPAMFYLASSLVSLATSDDKSPSPSCSTLVSDC